MGEHCACFCERHDCVPVLAGVLQRHGTERMGLYREKGGLLECLTGCSPVCLKMANDQSFRNLVVVQYTRLKIATDLLYV